MNDYTYDSLGRLIYSAKLQNQHPVLYTSHQYDTSNRIKNQNWQIGSDSFSESYTYNENDGTLNSMTSGGDALGFAYNNLKQLSGRTSPKLDMTYTYRTWTDTQNKQWQTNQVASVQYLKHGTDNLLLPTLNYSYDAVGNPLTYNNGKKNWTFTWKHGRQLATATDGTTTITNTYDVDGIRDSKTVGNVKHTYTTLGGKIVREAYGTYTIDYFYDNDSRPYKMVVKNGTSTVCTGYFVLNLQGDVIAIVDSEGAVAVKYQ